MNFKSIFSDHNKKLLKKRGPTIQQCGFHHSNMLAFQIKANFETQKNI